MQFFILGSQADQVCYLPYPSTKRSGRKVWLTVIKVNTRNRVQGKYNDTDLVILQQTDDDRLTETVPEIDVDILVDERHPVEPIDFEIGDSDPEDEFLCNLSSSEEDEEYDDD